jgi:hypothetical protein
VRGPTWRLAGLFGFALATRLVVLVLGGGPHVGGDSETYLSAARTIAQGGPLSVLSLPVERAPLYSLFLAPGVWLGVDLNWYAVVGNCLLGAATCVLLARIGYRATGSERIGLLAGALASVHLTFLFWPTYVLSDTFFLFILAVSAERLLVLTRSRRPILDALAAGASVLVVIGSRPNGAPFALGAMLFILLLARRHGRLAPRLLAGFVAPFAAVAVLWPGLSAVGGAASPERSMARSVEFARWIMYASIVWTEEGRGTGGVDVDIEPPPILERMTPDERAAYIQIDGRQNPLQFIAAEPRFFAMQGLRKAKVFWAPVMPEYSTRHAIITVAYFLPLYAFGAAGLLRLFRERSAFASLATIGIVSFFATSVVMHVDYDQRYRLPAELFLIPLAAVGIMWGITKVQMHTRAAGTSRMPDEGSHTVDKPIFAVSSPLVTAASKANGRGKRTR